MFSCLSGALSTHALPLRGSVWPGVLLGFSTRARAAPQDTRRTTALLSTSLSAHGVRREGRSALEVGETGNDARGAGGEARERCSISRPRRPRAGRPAAEAARRSLRKRGAHSALAGSSLAG